MPKHRRNWVRRNLRSAIVLLISAFLVLTGAIFLWGASLKMPDLNSFTTRQVSNSTKIYDRTGNVLLYDTGINAKRSAATLDQISPFIPQATIAIEDTDFYKNIGIEPTSIIRAILANFASGGYSQGASTITQQVVKNSLLTQDKTISRKIKEWILAVKLTRALSKDDILDTYLNETSYGGTIYGVEEASTAFFGHPAKDATLAEASYLAAIPQAPTYYSPYGIHTDALDTRHKVVLQRMKELGMISQADFDAAMAEKVKFLSKNDSSIRAPHFVMYVKDYLTQKYGEDQVANGGLRVTTTLDYSLQQKAEDVIKKFSPSLEKNFNASNTAMVAIDPKTGDILTMVGSRDYFDKEIQGNFNVTLAKRQPGSTLKPFVYATLFKKGFTPETILFDARTEFSTSCTVDGKPKNPADPPTVCYSPDEYDNNFEGPLTIRTALAQSRNVPGVKALYLAGIRNAIQTADDMGITSLTDPDRYGLTLVLGGGEVSPLELTSAYGVFANDGVRNPYRSILRVEDSKGKILEESSVNPTQVLDPNISRQISDILSDTNVRMTSLKPIGESIGRQVAIKTGTTNDYRDVWAVGYTPNLVVGAWGGKNDNTPMQHNVAGLIIAPVWGAFMAQAVRELPVENFKAPPPPLTDNKPVLRGVWQGGQSYFIDSVSGKVATDYTPPETRQEVLINSVHSILYWLNKDDPRGPAPKNPADDSQFEYWEYGVRNWLKDYEATHPEFQEVGGPLTIPTATDDVHVPGKTLSVTISAPLKDALVSPQDELSIHLAVTGAYPAKKTEVYINNKYILTSEIDPLNISFVPADVTTLTDTNTLSVIVYDTASNKSQASVNFSVQN